jgi:ABC-type nitrate/sulfonate/bicarbonate transport system permease component
MSSSAHPGEQAVIPHAAGGTAVPTDPNRARRWFLRALPWGATLALLALWQLAAVTGLAPEEIPAVTRIAAALIDIAPTARFETALVATLSQFAVGLIIGAVIGIVVGVAVGAVSLLYRLLHLPLDFFRFIPAVVYLPLMLLLLGGTPRVSTLLGAIGALWPMLFQTYYGVRGINDVLRDTARVFGLRPHQRLAHVVLPAVLPFVATGFRIAASHVLVVVVAVEIIASVPGIGSDIAVYASNGVYPPMYALVFVVGLLGVVVNVGLHKVERRLLHWHVSYRES